MNKVVLVLIGLVIVNKCVFDIKTQRPDLSAYEEKINGDVSVAFDDRESLVSSIEQWQRAGGLAETTVSGINGYHQFYPDAYTFIIFSPKRVIPVIGSLMSVDYLTFHRNCVIGPTECFEFHANEETFWFSSYRTQGPLSLLELDDADVYLSMALATFITLVLLRGVYFILRGPSLI